MSEEELLAQAGRALRDYSKARADFWSTRYKLEEVAKNYTSTAESVTEAVATNEEIIRLSVRGEVLGAGELASLVDAHNQNIRRVKEAVRLLTSLGYGNIIS
ncbi:MAG TPA: hypothetical protein VN828_03720 [Acidobacteriaceae bacterium]|nr:hypothetical protein [Acidobacteriaceae bacterium]